MSATAQQLYTQMGATPVINAVGNLTMLGGSTPSPKVAAAMETASRYYVDMDQLLEGTGARIAQLLEAEAALVTPGCAAALVLSTAACLSGTDRQKMAQLPDTTGMPNQVLMQKAQRYKYDHVIRLAGVQVVEVGSATCCSTAQLEAAITSQTLAILYPAHAEADGLVSVKEAIAIARANGIRTIIDAAFQVFPLDGLKRYTAWGADLVGYGAKYFGAPNSTGVLLGRKDLIEAARLHSFASFEKNALLTIGRPFKIDRQETIGVVVALEEWLTMDHDARVDAANRRAQTLFHHLGVLPHTTISDPTTDHSYTLILTLDETALGKTASQITQTLKSGSPSIWVWPTANQIPLSMHTVNEEDLPILADRLKQTFTA